jgi:hypothetical protein
LKTDLKGKRMSTKKFISKCTLTLLACTLTLAVSSYAFAATYYVDGSCQSSGDGTTAVCGTNGPWKTLSEAAEGVPSGENHTINIAAGAYAGFRDSRSGPGSTAEVDSSYRIWKATGKVTFTSMITISGNWVKMDGLSSSDLPKMLHANGSNCWFDHFTISHNTGVDAATINGTNNLVSNWDISNCKDYWHVFGSGHIFRGNYVHNHLSDGHIHDDVWQTYNPNVAQNIIIENNHVFMGNDATGRLANNPYSTHIFMWHDDSPSRKASGLIIRNNIFEAPGWFNSHRGHVDGLKIYNNLWRGDDDIIERAPIVIAWETPGGCDGVEIKNNLFIDKSQGVSIDASCTNVINSNNLFWRNDGGRVANRNYSSTKDIIGQNPGFISYDNDIYNLTTAYQLRSDSPAIDAGATIDTVKDDYDGISRDQQGSGYDIGPYEYTIDSDSDDTDSNDTGSDDTDPDDTGSDTTDNQAPIAKVGHYQVVKPGSRVTLDVGRLNR